MWLSYSSSCLRCRIQKVLCILSVSTWLHLNDKRVQKTSVALLSAPLRDLLVIENSPLASLACFLFYFCGCSSFLMFSAFYYSFHHMKVRTNLPTSSSNVLLLHVPASCQYSYDEKSPNPFCSMTHYYLHSCQCLITNSTILQFCISRAFLRKGLLFNGITSRLEGQKLPSNQ